MTPNLESLIEIILNLEVIELAFLLLFLAVALWLLKLLMMMRVWLFLLFAIAALWIHSNI
tara:strand:+ start:126 stop:305 length:180 start_codon:yes stop_codon:yes gene_type:complete